MKRFKAALIDMDGVLYDSMRGHAASWKKMCDEIGLDTDRDEFYMYEGMTGKATINLLMKRERGHEVSDEEAARLYAIKTANFRALGPAPVMPGAQRMIAALGALGMTRVLVTGSAQASLLDKLEHDYPGVFVDGRRVTALDVKQGKPYPEPYLKGASLVGADPADCMVVENAPLGVRAGKAAGCFVCAVMTGPVPREEFVKEGADMIFNSMEEFADYLEDILENKRQ
jgi:HAD superfamily hydrolase (TIGR01509 family)